MGEQRTGEPVLSKAASPEKLQKCATSKYCSLGLKFCIQHEHTLLLTSTADMVIYFRVGEIETLKGGVRGQEITSGTLPDSDYGRGSTQRFLISLGELTQDNKDNTR